MKIKGILQRGLVCLGACLLFAGMAVYADETGSEPESRTTMEASGVTNTMVVDETSGKTETLAKPSNGVLCSLYDVEVENGNVEFTRSNVKWILRIPKTEISGYTQEEIFI